MRLPILFLICCLNFSGLFAQQSNNEDADFIKKIHNKALTEGGSYQWLEDLTKNVGARLAGSPQSAAAVKLTFEIIASLGFDSVWLQPCMVPHWVRGEEEVRIVNSSKMGTIKLHTLTVGSSVGTGDAGITAEVIEVKSLKEVDDLDKALVKGKIVFYNGPMEATLLNTFSAYGKAVGQRSQGASRASKKGAVGVLVRSLTNKLDHVPHTGGLRYEEGVAPIPAMAISTKDADLLSLLLKEEKVRCYMRATCQSLADKQSYNVIGEIKGSEKPEEIIAVGGHLDSWDVGEGAHDDGAGCVQSIDVLYLLKELGYNPKRTLRCVMFMNEENGLTGGNEYHRVSEEKGEYHLAAIESDRGGFTPRGFTCDADKSVFDEKFKKVKSWEPLLKPYDLYFKKGGSGADIYKLKSQKGLLFGFLPDPQRYFDIHHAPTDVFETVNKRELELGAAAMTSLVYLLDKYGL